jgi:signal transduction histidine kinase
MIPGPFNPASVSALLSTVVAAIAAACAALLARVPDWDDVQPLVWVAATAAIAAGCNITATLDVPIEVQLWTGRVEVVALALHLCAWHVYLPAWASRSLSAPHRAALWALAAAGALALWPGAVYGDALAPRSVPWLGITYHDPVITPLGSAVLLVITAFGIWAFAMTVRLARTGAPFPGAHLACTGTILVMALHDAAVAEGLPLQTPYLLDLAFYGPITVLGLITLRRVSQSAIDLRHLSAGLAGLVAQRSSALARSQSALERSERLAAMGQFAAGLAQEVSGPATTVASRLETLAGALRDDPRGALWAGVRDAQAGVERIVTLARQLQLAGQMAGRSEVPLAPVAAAGAVAAALRAARARCGVLANLDVQLPPSLTVQAHEDSLVQVLSTLLVNALQAIPTGRDGTVTVRGTVEAGRVRLVVEDDGVGLSEEALQHLFEPFHPSKPVGMGTGLGLAVALGLVTGMQGELRFESTPGHGTRALLELGHAEPRAGGAGAAVAADQPAPARILIVDDDHQVLASMVRLLGRFHEVGVAAGVWAGLDALDAGGFDLVLCDVAMPSGGGERFWAELPLRAPWAMERVVFMTDASATREARAFLSGQPQPVLAKPFDLSAVEEVLAELRSPWPAERPEGPEGGGAGRPVGRVRRS